MIICGYGDHLQKYMFKNLSSGYGLSKKGKAEGCNSKCRTR
jgi:hypothetical protein